MKYKAIVLIFIIPIGLLFGKNEVPFIMARILKEPTSYTQPMKLKLPYKYLHDVDSTYNVDREVAIGIEDIKEASAKKTLMGSWSITIIFTETGKEKFSKLSKECIGQQLAILIDNELWAVPIIREQLTGGVAQLSGMYEQGITERFIDLVNGKANKSVDTTSISLSTEGENGMSVYVSIESIQLIERSGDNFSIYTENKKVTFSVIEDRIWLAEDLDHVKVANTALEMILDDSLSHGDFQLKKTEWIRLVMDKNQLKEVREMTLAILQAHQNMFNCHSITITNRCQPDV